MATPSPSRPGRPKPPPPTLVLLVRHGATPTTGKVLPGRAPGLHLGDSGRDQADAVAARLQAWASAGAGGPRRRSGARGRGPAVTTTTVAPTIYASPLERTRETAAPIAKALGQKVSVNRGLLECDFGEWTGADLKDLARKPEWSAVQRYPSGFRFPGGESFTAMQARIVDTVATLVSRHRGGTVILVSHADPIKAVVADALGTHLDLFQRIVVSPCSVTAISYAPTGPTVLAVNSTGTLNELRPS
ncbi:MAG: histidine phosphatase family protein [Actinomycetota bacterium]|nr:histidine phosphatase family protein [Actinomycetota bacterium]